jgi:hypothetical protein
MFTIHPYVRHPSFSSPSVRLFTSVAVAALIHHSPSYEMAPPAAPEMGPMAPEIKFKFRANFNYF